MPLVTTKDMFEKSMKEKFAIGAFNVNNMEIIQGIVDAAASQNSPVILQASSSAIKYARINYLKKMVEAALDEYDIPIALHLDHGPDFETCKMCVDHGFSSVMIDGSKYDFEENIALTKQVVEYAHSKGVVVEAELGKLAGIEDDVNVEAKDAMYTDPDQAKEFVERTGCDSLAIAIGTSHGAYKFKGEAKLRFDILKKVKEKIPNTPIVLHGASTIPQNFITTINKNGGNIKNAFGIPIAQIKKAISMNICKVNIDSDSRLAFTAGVRESLRKKPSDFNPRFYLSAGKENIYKNCVNEINKIMNSANKI